MRGIGFQQVGEEHLGGPGIDDDMVEAGRQHRAVGGGLDQREPVRAARGQVEGFLGHAREMVAHEALQHRGRVAAQVHLQQVGVGRHERGRLLRGGHDDLARPLVGLDDAGAQDRVARHGIDQRRAERGRIERAAQAQRAHHVVADMLAMETLREPQPMLQRRERDRRVGRGERDARRARGIAVEPLRQ